jgi:hypothetical protein
MKLVILLSNPEEEAVAISKALHETSIVVECEAGKVVLITDKLVPEVLDLNDHDLIHRTWNRVRELVAIMNGASCVEPGTLNKISLSNLAYTAEDGQRRHMPITAQLHAVLPAMRYAPPDLASFISLALMDTAAAKALRLFSGDSDWVNLYRVYEVIEEAARPGIVKSGWATNAEMRRFKMSANKASITGDASRHGNTGNAVTSAQGMSRVEAAHLIGRILRLWLNSKLATCRNHESQA